MRLVAFLLFWFWFLVLVCVLSNPHRDFPIRLENPHVISSTQIAVGVFSAGPSNVTLNASFRNRSSGEYVAELGNSIGA